MKSIFLLFFLFFQLGITVFANVKPNSLFTNNMVLQQGVAVPVWGTAGDNEAVTVEFCGQSVSTVAIAGKWLLKLTPLTAGGPFQMIVKGQNTLTISNILVGEVWLCSGQSNMQRALGLATGQKPIVDWQNEAKDAQKYPQIRQFSVPRITSPTPLEDVYSTWAVCDSLTAKSFCAVGFFFARSLTQSLQNVPVGLIFTAYGGSKAQNWVSRSAVESTPKLKTIVDVWDKAIADYTAALNKFKLDSATAVTAGSVIPTKPTDITRSGNSNLGGLFNSMLSPLIPYAMKGVLWYQGESDINLPRQYQTLFPTLISDWRKMWNMGDFPFLYVQIAPYALDYPELREAQLLTLAKTAHTAMVVTADVGDSADIHPANKRPVGERLALAARALVYKEAVVYSGPVYSSMQVQGNSIVLNFDHAQSGLLVKGDALTDFVISGDGKLFVPAKAVISGNTVIVSSDAVPSPVAARMGWANVPHVNLFNAEGLPATPFRTDADQKVFFDDFTTASRWTAISNAIGGSVVFSNNSMKLTANPTASIIGMTSITASADYNPDSVDVQFEFNSSSLAFRIYLGVAPSRIQLLQESTTKTSIRLCGEGTSTTTGAKIMPVSLNSWHTMKVKYRKTLSSAKAIFILDDAVASAQTVDLSLQSTIYNFMFNTLSINALNGEVLQVRNFTAQSPVSTPTAIKNVVKGGGGLDRLIVKNNLLSFVSENECHNPVKLQIHSLMGAKLIEKTVVPTLGIYSMSVNELQSGVYLLSAQQDGQIYTGKVMIQ